MNARQPDPERRRLIDTLTEAALALDQSQFADWWSGLDDVALGAMREAAEEAFRRAYFVAFIAGAGSELLKRGSGGGP